jgi:hypothetical protein
MIDASPTLTVAGLTVPAAASGELFGIEQLGITWGRESLIDHPTPATARVVLLDTSRRRDFASRAGATDVIGELVTLGWAGGGSSGTNFRGRITDVQKRPVDGGIRVALSCSSKEVDAAQYRAAQGAAWPSSDSMATRLARIVGLMPTGYFAGGVTPPTKTQIFGSTVGLPWSDYWASEEDVGGADALALLRQLWSSTYPVPLVYNPETDALTFAYRRRITATSSAHIIPGTGLGGLGIPVPVASGGLAMDADQFEYDSDASLPLDARISHVEVSWRDRFLGNAFTTKARTIAAADALGRRTVSVSSIRADEPQVTELAADWEDLVSSEVREHRLEPLTYSTEANGGFDTVDHARALLTGHERGTQIFIRGSWLPSIDVRPLFSILGGVVGYARGQWTVQLRPGAFAVGTPGIKLYQTGTVRVWQIHRSVTVGDLRFVDVPIDSSLFPIVTP